MILFILVLLSLKLSDSWQSIDLLQVFPTLAAADVTNPNSRITSSIFFISSPVTIIKEKRRRRRKE
jgi:hypothetical protein